LFKGEIHLYIKNIKLNNFRNYTYKEIEFSPKTNIFYGENANGKTNILEAMYICSTGKSFRTRKDSEMILFDKKYGSVDITFIKEGREKKINFLIADNNKKQIKINGIKISKISEIFGNMTVVLFSPEDIDFVKGEPNIRRKFFDILISQIKPSYIFLLQEYYNILEQRNKLLKTNRKINDIEMDIWDERLASLNIKIKNIRKFYIEKLAPYFTLYSKEISEQKEESTLVYKTQIKEDEEEILKKLKEKRNQDFERGFTSVGVHRDDYKIKINELEIENFGSQGQIRTAILSLKLAQKEIIEEETGEKPILLLDDVMSELDRKRREYIAKEIKDNQVIITCTDIEDIKIEKENTFIFKIEKQKEGIQGN
jgi:DNA replication and repair protein RecF